MEPLAQAVRSYGVDLLQWVFPANCAWCDAPLGGSPTLCVSCWNEIPRWHGPRCDGCGTPTDAPSFTCAQCLEPPGGGRLFRRLRAATAYVGAARIALRAMKFRARPGLTAPLAQMLFDVRPPLLDWGAYEAIVPVPLHRAREAERGYCQTTLLARHVGRRVSLPVEKGALRRVRATVQLWRRGDAEARRREVQGAFRAQLPDHLVGRPLLLLDDIVTTGSTANECARVLREAGSGPIDVICVARARRRADASFEDMDDDHPTWASLPLH